MKLDESTSFAVERPSSITAPPTSSVPTIPVSWTPSSPIDVRGYDLELRGPSASGEWRNVFSGTATSTEIRITVNGTYALRVRACTSLDCSSWTPTVTVVVDLDLEAYLGVDPCDPDPEPVPANEPVGIPGGEAGVSGGKATYQIPIVMAPGRRGLQPALSLSYSHGGGNSLAGVGWGLNGFSKVSRCARTFAQDGVARAVEFSEEDRLCLDGHRLVLITGTYGEGDSEYRTEIETFRRIFLRGKMSEGTSYFEVQDKSGTTSYYGAVDGYTPAVEILPGASVPSSWWIRSTRDPQTNSIDYAYVSANGEVHPHEILYTGFNGSFGDRAIRFEKELRPDVESGYRRGGRSKLTQRFTEIRTEVGSQLVRRYVLRYSESKATGRSLLTSVEECSSDGCLPKTRFQYSDDPADYVWEDVPGSTGENSIVRLAGDYGGDGIRDYVRKEVTEPWGGSLVSKSLIHYPSLAEEQILGGIWDRGFDIIPGGSLGPGNADFDGDGKADLVGVRSGFLVVRDHQGQETATDISVTGTPVLSQSSDFNGDGRTDLMLSHSAGVNTLHFQCAPASNGELRFCVSATLPALGDRSIKQISDIDGDGLPDFFADWHGAGTVPSQRQPPLESLIIFMRESGGTYSFESRTLPELGAPSGSLSQHRERGFIDVNGDSHLDLYDLSGWDIWLNTGVNFVNVAVNGDAPIKPRFWSDVLIADDNGDGRASILIPAEVQFGWCYWVWDTSVQERLDYCSTPGYPMHFGLSHAPQTQEHTVFGWDAVDFQDDGSGGLTLSKRPTNITAPIGQSTVEDHFGDGLLDVRFRMENTWGLNQYGENAIRGEYAAEYTGTLGTKIAKNIGPHPDLLVAAWSASSVSSNWSYAPLSSTSQAPSAVGMPFYEISSRSPNSENFMFSSSMIVVSAFSQRAPDDGRVVAARHYQYRDAMANSRGRGFLGFRQIIEEQSFDDGDDLRMITTFHQNFPLTGTVHETSVALVTDPLNRPPISRAIYDWRTDERGGRWFNYLKQMVETNRDLHHRGWVSTSTQSVIYLPGQDFELGNVSSQETKSEDPTGRHRELVENTYDYSDVAGWWIDKKTHTRVTTDASEYTSEPTMVPFSLYPENTQKVVLMQTNYRQDRLPEYQVVQPDLADELNRVDFNSYDQFGNLLESTVSATRLPAPRVTSQTYSSDGYFVETMTNALDQTSSFTFDPRNGQKATEVDPNMRLTMAAGFDGFGRVIGTSKPGEAFVDVRYVSCGQGRYDSEKCVFKVVTHQRGAPIVATQYDALGRPIKTIRSEFGAPFPYGLATATEYDRRGRVERITEGSVTSPVRRTTSFLDYDALGRLGKKIDPVMTTEYSYDGLTTTINVAGELTAYRTHNARGQLVETIDAIGSATKYRYDGHGNLILIEDKDRNQLRAAFDTSGQKTMSRDPNGGTWTFTYDGLGTLISQLDANGSLIALQRDPLDRVTHRYVNGELDSTWIYDTRKIGRLSTETKFDVSTRAVNFTKELYYDPELRPIKVTATFDGLAPYEIETAYDCNGNVRGIEYPNDEAIELEYTPRGHLFREINALPATQPPADTDTYREIQYVADIGVPTREYFGNGVYRTTRVKHGTGQLEAVCFSLEEPNDEEYINFDCEQYERATNYYYEDKFGNLTHQTKRFSTSSSFAEVGEWYTYDKLHRLRTSTRDWFVGPIAEVAYDYDPLGNIKLKSDYASSYSYGTSTRTNPANAGPHAIVEIDRVGVGRVADFRYDENGNQIAGNGRIISYTPFNKPERIEENGIVTTFAYDASGARYKQESPGRTTRYIGGIYEEVITANGTLEQIAYLGSSVVVTRKILQGRTIRWLHKDRLGSIDAVLDEGGNVIEEHNFDPFGMPRNSGWQDTNGELHSGEFAVELTMHGFTGHEHLDQHRLIHMNGRVYDPALGRFLSVDPIVQEKANSQSLNAYSYIFNNPLSGIDPSGYKACYAGPGLSCNVEQELLPPTTGSSIPNKRTTYTVSDGHNELQVVHDTTNGSRSTTLNGRSVSPEDISDHTLRSAALANENAANIRDKTKRDDIRYGGSVARQMQELKETLAIYGLILQVGPILGAVAFAAEEYILFHLIGRYGAPKVMAWLNVLREIAEAGRIRAPAMAAAGAGGKVVAEVVENGGFNRGGPMLAETIDNAAKGGAKALSKEAQRGIRSLEKRIAEHEAKLADFKANPTVRPGMENQPKEVIEASQQARIRHLETEIQAFKENIEKLMRGG